MRKISVSIILFLTIFIVSCGSADMSKEDAGNIYSLVTAAIGEAQSDVMYQLAMTERLNKKIKNWEIDENDKFSGTLDGENGGSAAIGGYGVFNGQSFDINFDIIFDTYVSVIYGRDGETSDVILDGTIAYSYAGNSETNEATYFGLIDVTGALIEIAEFDVTIKTSPGNVEITGKVGGQKIGDSTSY